MMQHFKAVWLQPLDLFCQLHHTFNVAAVWVPFRSNIVQVPVFARLQHGMIIHFTP